MTIQAQLADGRILEFPDGTDPAVIQATVKRIVQGDKQPQVGANVNPDPHLAELDAISELGQRSTSPQQQVKPLTSQDALLEVIAGINSGARS